MLSGKAPDSIFYKSSKNYLHFSHCWLATPQEVLHADWQEVWHSPQPPVLSVFWRLRVLKVLILFMVVSPLKANGMTPQYSEH
jgi:hypothetical protein